MRAGDHTVNLDSEPQDVVSLEELKKRLNADRQESISRFSDLRLLGIGGVSEVFSGKDRMLNREVAIKVLRPASRSQLALVEGFVREARATAQIAHPNIIPVHEMGVFDDAGLYFTMKKVSGETLRNLIERINNKDPEALKSYSLHHLLEIFIAAGQAVAYAHSRGVVHCDLKPGNIMLGEYGEVLVMDWGLVRHFANGAPESQKLDLVGSLPEDGLAQRPVRNNTSALGGTPAFMAPEMFTAKADPSPETDQYALGCILYCILTNSNSPFPDGLSVEHLMGIAARGAIVRPRKRAKHLNIPRELEAICLKAMDMDPAKRYSSVVDMLKDVRNFLDSRPVMARPPNIAARLFKVCIRHPFIPVTLITALIVAAFAYTWWKHKLQLYHADTNYMITDIVRNGDFIYSRALYAAGDKDYDAYKKTADMLSLGAEFDYFYTRLIEQLSGIANMGSLDREHQFLLLRLAKQQIHFARTTRQMVFLERFSDMLDQRKNAAFSAVFAEDPELQEDLKMTANKEGTVTVTFPATLSVTVMPGTNNKSPARQLISGEPAVMPQGDYVLQITSGTNSVNIPFHLYLGMKENFAFSSIPRPVDGCVPVIPPLHPENYFYISQSEVSGSEYADFLKNIKNEAVRARYADKVIMEPGAMPVRGVSREQAEGFCAYLSEKTGRNVRLPSLNEWRLAAWGAPEFFAQRTSVPEETDAVSSNSRILSAVSTNSSDISPYGVRDMAGNVRELVNSQLNRPGFTITCGGSWLAPYEYRQPERTANASGGETDVGFRYAVEAGE